MEVQSNSKILNLFLIGEFEKEDGFRRHQQRQTYKGTLWWPKNNPEPAKGSWAFRRSQENIKINNKLPEKVEEPLKWANTSFNRNIREFMKHNALTDTGNPFNDHSHFENAVILTEGWITPFKISKVNPKRKLNEGHMNSSRFMNIFASVGFDKENPICLDRYGNILDGVQRMNAMANIWGMGDGLFPCGFATKVYIRQNDFE